MADETKPGGAPDNDAGIKDNAGILADAVEQFTCLSCGATIDVKGLPAFSDVSCQACGAQTTVPQKLGNFLLMRLIGTGGMGGVYFARDEQLGRDVAIKVMLQSLGDDAQFIETFRHEAQAVAKLNHANIAQIYSFGQEKGQPYIVMELVSGERVDELMEKPGGLTSREALRVCLEIAQGLSAADEAGLVHGDIKPENILLDKKRNAKLVDFGLATVAHQNAGEGIWGTPYYIAPEKIRRQKLDARSDIYSLGATLYHMLTRQPPFEGETPVEVVKARLEAPPPDPRDVDPELPPIVSEIILRMLAVERTERYPNYRSLISDLRKAVQTFDADGSKTPTLTSGKSIRIKKKGSSSESRPVPSDSKDAASVTSSGKKLVIHKSNTNTSATGKFTIRAPGTGTVIPQISDEERAAKREKQRRRRRQATITTLSILFIIGATAGGITYWIHYQDRVAQQREASEVRTLQQEVDRYVSDISANHGRIERTLTEIQPLIVRIKDTAERMNVPIQAAPAPQPQDEEGPEDQDEGAENTVDEEPAGAPRSDGPEVNLVREVLQRHERMQNFQERVEQKETEALAMQQQLASASTVRQATEIRNAVQSKQRASDALVDDMQRLLQELRRSGRRLEELRERFDAEERRRIAAEEEQKRRAEQRAAEEQAQREQREQGRREISQIATLEGSLQNLLDVNDFDTAYHEMRRNARNFTTEIGQEAFQHALERYRYLARMKANIIAGIEAAPFPWGFGAGAQARDIIGASERGLQIRGMDGMVPWNRIQPPQMTRLIDRYMDSRDILPRQRMEIAFGAALYMDLFGEEARERARYYATRAMDLGLRRQTFDNVLESRWAAGNND